MKFLAVFVALLSLACGHQAQWNINQLSDAIQSPSTDPALLPYLEHALNEMMDSLYAGDQVYTTTVTIPAIDLSAWTLAQLSDALQNPSTDAALVPYLEEALNQMMVAIVSDQLVGPATAVVVPAMEVSLWTLYELSEAIQDPTTNPALIPLLEEALNEMMHAIFDGQQMEAIIVVAPAGLLPVDAPVAPIPVVPTPVESPIAPLPVVPSPIESPVAPTPVESPIAPSSPLVQIIVNVNKGAGVAPAPVITPQPVITPEPVITPQPVIVVEQPEIIPQPVIVVDGPAVNPTPVIIVDGPLVVPEPVIVVDGPSVQPEPVIIGTPILPEPVIIGTPILPNPIDIMHPIVVPVGAGAGVVGPIA